jgi:hypothetical protein
MGPPEKYIHCIIHPRDRLIRCQEDIGGSEWSYTTWRNPFCAPNINNVMRLLH